MTDQEFTTLTARVEYAVRTTRRPLHVSVDDIRSEGWVGALRALAAHDPTRGSLSTYAALRIRGSILDFLRAQPMVGRTRRGAFAPTVSLDHVLEAGFEPMCAPASTEGVDVDRLASRAALSPREQEALALYRQGMGPVDLSHQMHVSQSRGSALVIDAVRKMRAAA